MEDTKGKYVGVPATEKVNRNIQKLRGKTLEGNSQESGSGRKGGKRHTAATFVTPLAGHNWTLKPHLVRIKIKLKYKIKICTKNCSKLRLESSGDVRKYGLGPGLPIRQNAVRAWTALRPLMAGRVGPKHTFVKLMSE